MSAYEKLVLKWQAGHTAEKYQEKVGYFYNIKMSNSIRFISCIQEEVKVVKSKGAYCIGSLGDVNP